MGSYLLRYFVLYLDYRNERLILEPGDHCCEKVPDLFAGLSVSLSEADRATVREVTEGSCAEEAGFQVGDTVLSLNGNPLRGPEDLQTLRETLRQEEGTEVGIVVQRGGRRLSIHLTLRDYFSMRRSEGPRG